MDFFNLELFLGVGVSMIIHDETVIQKIKMRIRIVKKVVKNMEVVRGK